MNLELLVERLFEALLNGDRPLARTIIGEATAAGLPATDLFEGVFWPTYTLLDRLHREDKVAGVAYQCATRLMRVLVDREAVRLEQRPRNGQRIFACCGPTEGDELGAQMAVDLLEAGGFSVVFAGGGLPSDEIMAQVHQWRPDQLVVFASSPSDLPGLRAIVDSLREVNACPNLRISVGGGVFNRVEGLADEIGIRTWAETPMELVERLLDPEPQLAPTRHAAPAQPRRRMRPAA